ncbi:MAG: beta-glucosidase [Lewinellaceae bacterium]|nr:beta-glucosidase [Saprospiraceae bacterium]MCB9340463.1 beta-glucosidase [Lewinellaceae bacterium]
MRLTLLFSCCTMSLLLSCSQPEKPVQANQPVLQKALSDEALTTLVQKQTFQYFWDGAEPISGLARERFHSDNEYPVHDKDIVTSGGSGFGVMAILVGIERGFITRQEGFERLKKNVDWLEKCDRFHGVWPHWWTGATGKVYPFSKKDDGGDLVETSYLVQGLLCVRQYFKDGNEEEKALAGRIDALWKAVEWDWHRGPNKENVIYWHWSPNFGWEMNFKIHGWNECLITYVLAACSPTHGVPAEVYHEGWAQNGAIVLDKPLEKYGYNLALRHQAGPNYGGPLFWAHYSFLGLDPRHLKDKYANYWEQNKNQVLIDFEYCVENSKNCKGYGKNCWGLTSSYSMKGYAGHMPDEDLCVISPTAALSSFPYTPEQSTAAMRHFYEDLGNKLWGEYGFYDAFSEQNDWWIPRYLAIDQGPVVVMMENYKSGLLWNLFMSCPEVQAGLTKLGFEYK